MTEIGRKALEFVNEICHEWGVSSATDDEVDGSACFTALCRSIEQHEAFRQEVSDAAEHLCRFYGVQIVTDKLERFIIAKPDPLVIEAREICARVCEGWIDIPKDRAAAYRAGSHDDEADFAYVYAALAKRGGRIVFDD